MFAAALVLVGLGLLVMLHELGHAAAARALGLEVTDLSFGLGPSLLARQLGGVTVRLALVPFGGFVRVSELAPVDEVESDPKRFWPRSVASRLAVIAAGSALNLVFASALVAVVTGVWGRPTGQIEGLEVTAVSTTVAAEGLRPSDLVVAVSGRPVRQVADLTATLAESEGSRVAVAVERGGRRVELELTPRRRGDRWGFGARYFSRPRLEPAGALVAIVEGLRFSVARGAAMVDAVAEMLALEPSGERVRLVSAVGLADRVSRSGRWDLRRALLFAALLSVVVGLFNLLPLPGLDGGRVVLELIEWARRRRLSARIAVAIQLSGALLLLLTWALIIAADLGL